MAYDPKDIAKKVYSRLSNDATLINLLGGQQYIYSTVPDDKALQRFIVYSLDNIIDNDTKTENGYDHEITFNIITRLRTQEVTLDIASRLYNLFHRQPLSLDSGQQSVDVEFIGQQSIPKTDSATSHVVMRFNHIIAVTN